MVTGFRKLSKHEPNTGSTRQYLTEWHGKETKLKGNISVQRNWRMYRNRYKYYKIGDSLVLSWGNKDNGRL